MEINFNNICRICMQEDDNFINISGVDVDFIEFSTKLYFCIPTVQIDDTNFPQQLCVSCLEELRTSYKFKKKCIKSTQKIKHLLYANDSSSENNFEIVSLRVQPEYSKVIAINQCSGHSFELGEETKEGESDEDRFDLNEEKKETKSNEARSEINEEIKETEIRVQKETNDNSDDPDENLDDILNDKFGDDIEEKYDEDHIYSAKRKKHLSENEKSSDSAESINIKIETVELMEDLASEENLRETVFDPIFQNLTDLNNSSEEISGNNRRDSKLEKNENDPNDIDPIFSNSSEQIESTFSQSFQAEEIPINYQYFCTICNRGFKEDLFKEHSKCHNDKETISCPTCKRVFHTFDMTLFFRHYCPQHNRPFRFTCTVCYRKFKNSQALANHRKIHTEDKTEFLCSYCDICFPTTQKLYWHMRNGIHTDRITKKLKRLKNC